MNKQRVGQTLCCCSLVTACDDDTGLRGLSAHHVYAGRLFVGKGHATDGGLRFLLDFCLGLGRTVPMAEEETAVLHLFLELFVVVTFVDTLVAILACFFEDVLLDVLQELLDIVDDAFQGTRLLFEGVAAHDLDGAVLQVAGTQYQAYGHTL